MAVRKYATVADLHAHELRVNKEFALVRQEIKASSPNGELK